LLTSAGGRADEGMWPLHGLPRAVLKERYGFEPSSEWVTRMQHAAVRFADGGSGAFVSQSGLVLTNHHVARGFVYKLSTAKRDLLRDGFYAATGAAELPCPDAEISVLDSYSDVSERVRGAGAGEAAGGSAGGAGLVAHAQRKQVIASLEKECSEGSGMRCEVVTLYGGGQYWLYRYRRYSDVRLVFAPEEQAAAFGDEYDNFTYPRYALDFALLRVYENGKPLSTPGALHLRSQPAQPGELLLVPGHPASTNRGLTLAQLRYHREVLNPLSLTILEARLAALSRYAAAGAEQARRSSALRSQLENQLKRLRGQQAGLQDPAVLARKEQEEGQLLSALRTRPESIGGAGGDGHPIARIERAYASLPAQARRLSYGTLSPSRLASLALSLLRYSVETEKPNGVRYEEFRDSRLPSLRAQILSPAPIYPDLEEAVLADWLTQQERALGAKDPLVQALLGGRSPAEVARQVVGGTALLQVAARKALLDGGKAALAQSRDPLIALLRRADPQLRELRAYYDEQVQAIEVPAQAQIAEARFLAMGKSVYPDATFTLRLSFGQPLGYEKNTTLVPYQTLFYGLFERALAFGQKPPFQLAPRIAQAMARGSIDPTTPLNFVYTADTIGGNSGSPVVDRHGAVVGLNFDSNIEKLPNRYYYVPEEAGSRAVAVHSVAILAALERIYDAGPLAAELRRPPVLTP
ncbi:MAG TPA: S46 family peptidase, partial [Pseudomonadota bacterium]|nr:S46 family peptidase [Pseudomonadota bacterium]